jgi:DNA polymerase III epsilon subunit-like protein
LTITPIRQPSSINWENVIYVVFDLETTGFNRQRNEIIELSAIILDRNVIMIEDATFSHLIKPRHPIPRLITDLPSITNEDVSTAEPFPQVAGSFVRFMQQHANESDHTPIEHIILAGHNSQVFDIPFFVAQLRNHNLEEDLFGDNRFGFALDSMRIAKDSVRKRICTDVPTKYNLKDLFEFVSGQVFETGHRAYEDVKATITILRHAPFWSNRKENLFQFAMAATTLEAAVDYSEDDDDSSNGEARSMASSGEEEEDDEEDVVALGNRWEADADFDPIQPTPLELFEQHFTLNSRSQRKTTGLQCSPVDVTSPARAWRFLFTKSMLDKIVKYTNEYGLLHAKKWVDISRKDLESFLSILFISGIQKRKDKPSNWFSDNRLLENPVMKTIMSGRKFSTMMRYLHCCPAAPQDPTAPDYDPAYKIAEFRDTLEERFTKAFCPGQQLSLDETLLRAFGRIKFKVRIVSKAARYGIKIYVITDARTAYVLRVLIYTGKSTYNAGGDAPEHPMKTVQVVKKLVEPFKDTFRTIYIDRFYTSLELLKSLADQNLFVTGTMLANRILADIRIAKTSREFRNMKRGDAVKSKFVFYKTDGTRSECGLVGWKDRNMVYCLSNDTNNHMFDECCRRGDGGIIRIPRPLSISNYNKYMGGVDLADMIRLFCDSTIRGQKRWWLNIFFYLVDVGTSNARVLYNERLRTQAEQRGIQYKPMGIRTFKMHLVEDLVGKKMEALRRTLDDEVEELEHTCGLIPNNVRARCAYCSLMSRGNSRTRFQCVVCKVPLCPMGSGRVKHDCFSEAHKTEERQHMVLQKYLQMQKKNSKQK